MLRHLCGHVVPAFAATKSQELFFGKARQRLAKDVNV